MYNSMPDIVLWHTYEKLHMKSYTYEKLHIGIITHIKYIDSFMELLICVKIHTHYIEFAWPLTNFVHFGLPGFDSLNTDQ